MKKKKYTPPTMSVAAVRQQSNLLASSSETNTKLKVEYDEEDWEDE